MTDVDIVEEPPEPDAIIVDEPESDQPEEKPEEKPEEAPEKKKVEDQEAEEEEEAAASDEEPAKPKRRSSAKQRIDELTAARRSAERVAELERNRADRLAEALASRQPQPQAQPQAAPKQDDFENYDEFLVAKAKHEVRHELRAELQEAQQRGRESQQQTRAREAANAFNTRAADARARYEDFDEVAFSDVNITDTMTQVIVNAEKGPDIAYFLGSNPERAAQISSLSPLDQAREIGLIEASLDLPKKTTNAPKPAKTLAKGNAGVKSTLENCSYDDYKKRRMG